MAGGASSGETGVRLARGMVGDGGRVGVALGVGVLLAVAVAVGDGVEVGGMGVRVGGAVAVGMIGAVAWIAMGVAWKLCCGASDAQAARRKMMKATRDEMRITTIEIDEN